MIRFFENISEVLAVMSERKNGSMKLFKDNNLNLENRESFFQKIGIRQDKVISAEIVHGAHVEVVDDLSSEIILGADGMVTQRKDIFLSVTVADCIPVYLYDVEQKVIGIAHCGWRGIIGGIIENTMNAVFRIGGNAKNLRVALGPGINSCHFEIGEDVLSEFMRYTEQVVYRDGKIFVDLKGIIGKQLSDFGVCLENIEDAHVCTAENSSFFSCRRDRPKVTEAMIALIGFRIS